MTDAEQFELVLAELRGLLLALADMASHVALVGGQVLSLEARALGRDAVIEVRTPTGIVVQRGYSMEPDLLIDVDALGPRAEVLLDVLRQRGFTRMRSFRWTKQGPAGRIDLDLFVPDTADEANDPAFVTRLPQGDLVLSRAKLLHVEVRSGVLEVAVPDPVGFVAMKAEAKLRLRPADTKDSFDLYVYSSLKTPEVLGRALAGAGGLGKRLLGELRSLFGTPAAAGVVDVVTYAGLASDEERALLAQAVVDLFERVVSAAGGE